MTRRSLRALLVLVSFLQFACGGKAPTPVAGVADVATKIELSANAILHAAQTANATVSPSTGQPLVSRQALDDVALGVNAIGRAGLTLKAALDDYNAAKAAGANPTAQVATVQRILADINTALTAIGKAIPSGTIQAIDNAAAAILTAIAQVKASTL